MRQLDPLVIGIDFGTAYSRIAWFDPKTEQARILRNAEEEEKTPSVVYFGSANEVLVGTRAEEMIEDDDTRAGVAVGIKRDLTSKAPPLPGRAETREDVVAHILRKLKRDAEQLRIQKPVTRAVITAPVSFSSTQWQTIENAAKRVGFSEVTRLDEPEAAAIAYCHAGLLMGNNVLVYDLGADTFDLTVLVREDDGHFRRAMPAQGIPRCAGNDFDRALYQHLEGIIRKECARSISQKPGSFDLGFLHSCRKYKQHLSSQERVNVKEQLPGRDRRVFSWEIARNELERLIEPMIEETLELTRRTMQEASQRRGCAIDTVVLIGGSSRIPLVMAKLKKLPGEASVVQPVLADTAVALGAAYFAAGRLNPTANAIANNSEVARPPTPESRGAVDRAWQYVQADDLHHAFFEAQAACDSDESNPEAYYTKAYILLQQDKPDLAIFAADNCIRLDPSHLLAYRMRGDCKLKLKTPDFVGARDDFSKHIELTNEPEGYWLRSFADIGCEEYEAALCDMRIALQSPTVDAQHKAYGHSVAGRLLYKLLNRPEEALDCFKKALEALPEDSGDRSNEPALDPITFEGDSLEPEEELLDGFADLLGKSGIAMGDNLARESPRGLIQRHLWEVCKVLLKGCTRESVELMYRYAAPPIDPFAWKDDPDFPFFSASYWAGHGRAAEAHYWLERLFAVQPAFSVDRVADDRGIRSLEDSGVKQFIGARFADRALVHISNNQYSNAMDDLRTSVTYPEADSAPAAAIHTVLGYLEYEREKWEIKRSQAALGSFKRAIGTVPQQCGDSYERVFFDWCSRAGIDVGQNTFPRPSPLALVQKLLWEQCKSQKGCTREAAVLLCDYSLMSSIEDFAWRADPTFALFSASYWAEQGNTKQAQIWLKKLFRLHPDFDVKVAKQDKCIRALSDKDVTLREYLTPKLVVEAPAGFLFNRVKATNKSDFGLTAVVITIEYHHTHYGLRTTGPLKAREIGPHSQVFWEAVFDRPGFLGNKIEIRARTIVCDELDV